MDFKLSKSLKENLEDQLAELKLKSALIEERINEIEALFGTKSYAEADKLNNPPKENNTNEFDYLNQTEMVLKTLRVLGKATSAQIADHILSKTDKYDKNRVKQFTSFNIYRLHIEGKLGRQKKDAKSYTYWIK